MITGVWPRAHPPVSLSSFFVSEVRIPASRGGLAACRRRVTRVYTEFSCRRRVTRVYAELPRFHVRHMEVYLRVARRPD